VTWFILRAKRHRSTALFLKGHEQADQKAVQDETTQASSKKKGKPSVSGDRKQKLLEELLALDQDYEAGKLSKAVYQERRNKAKARLRSLIEV
jgi:hypothetical protein